MATVKIVIIDAEAESSRCDTHIPKHLNIEIDLSKIDTSDDNEDIYWDICSAVDEKLELLYKKHFREGINYNIDSSIDEIIHN